MNPRLRRTSRALLAAAMAAVLVAACSSPGGSRGPGIGTPDTSTTPDVAPGDTTSGEDTPGAPDTEAPDVADDVAPDAGGTDADTATCTPTTCAAEGRTCGALQDGCGTLLDCGSCGDGQACVDGACEDIDGACLVGDVRCSEGGFGVQGCGPDGDGEAAWGVHVPCQANIPCVAGRCQREDCLRGEVIVLLDRSSSMIQSEAWEWVRDTTLAAIEARHTVNLFGFRHFPGAEACSTGEVVPLSEDAYPAIEGAIVEPTATSATPIAAALDGLTKRFGDPNDGQAVILVTDGDETCDTQAGAREHAGHLFHEGIPVHVLAVTTTANKSFLDKLAASGGTSHSHLVKDPAEMSAALGTVFDAIGACETCPDGMEPSSCDGGTLTWCDYWSEDEVVRETSCAATGAACGESGTTTGLDVRCLSPEGEPCPGADDHDFACAPSSPVCHQGTCCAPDCAGRECGPDGCGGTCGPACEFGECVDGQCDCTPDCDGRECGPDGCGGTCGPACEFGECVDGQCECEPDCADKQCGDDGCGSTCGTCTDGFSCDENQQCVYPCGEITGAGCCDDQQLYYCYDNKLHTEDCTQNHSCGINLNEFAYSCGTPGLGDPTGLFPKECPEASLPP
ncbi:MAG: vWA domain-containing protein [Myxococcota bacterium]